MDSVQALTKPEHLFSRAEVLSKPTPVPAIPGIYAWYFRNLPDFVPTEGCVEAAGRSLLYVGISPKNEHSGQNLRRRIRQHFAGNAEGSTLRKTLGVLLTEESGYPLRRVGSGHRKTFTHLGEQWLDAWMAQNAFVCWVGHPAPYEAESAVIHRLCLPLNIQHNEHHSFSSVVSKMRRRASRRANEEPIASEQGQQRQGDHRP